MFFLSFWIFFSGAVICSPMGLSDETTTLRLPKQFCQLGCITLKSYSEVSLLFFIYLNRNNFKISMLYGHCFRQNLKCPPRRPDDVLGWFQCPSSMWHWITQSKISSTPILNTRAHSHSIAMPTSFYIAFSPPPWRFHSIPFSALPEVPYGM